jgi:hypothetical protein
MSIKLYKAKPTRRPTRRRRASQGEATPVKESSIPGVTVETHDDALYTTTIFGVGAF